MFFFHFFHSYLNFLVWSLSAGLELEQVPKESTFNAKCYKMVIGAVCKKLLLRGAQNIRCPVPTEAVCTPWELLKGQRILPFG